MEAIIRKSSHGAYSPKNKRWLEVNAGMSFYCVEHNMNYVRFGDGILCHVHDCTIIRDAETKNPKPKTYPRKWETINTERWEDTERIKVVGGWMVRTIYHASAETEGPLNLSMIFIPDPNHEWILEPQTEKQ